MILKETDIREKCSVQSNRDAETFVGLMCDHGDIQIFFPLGYHIAEDAKGLRRDILQLFAVLAANTRRKDSEIAVRGDRDDEVDFPLLSYLYLIKDYFARGYYREREFSCRRAKKGKIDWNRTIKTIKPCVQDNDVFYLDFVTRKNEIKENEWITLIHEYCVYESFARAGWLFTDSMPKKPRIVKKEKLFRALLHDKLSHTFNDRNRTLFSHMLAIVDYRGDKDADKNYRYGTYRFEYVWEKMIDKVFGIGKKEDYFPKTAWHVDGKRHDNAFLEPDTVMIYRDDVYLLDAKYYKYGVTCRAWDLPGSASIEKQITYGEYVAEEKKFRERHGENMNVFNAFLMPFDSLQGKYAGGPAMIKIGEAISDWKTNAKEYEKIRGILIDVKMLMNLNVRQDENVIKKMAELIK